MKSNDDDDDDMKINEIMKKNEMNNNE